MLLFPFLSVVGATAVVRLLLPTAGGAGALTLHIVAALVLYLTFLFLFGTIGGREAKWLFGSLRQKNRSLAQK